MKSCPECKNEIGEGAASCPNCGHKFTQWTTIAIGVVISLVVISWVVKSLGEYFSHSAGFR